LAEQYNRADGTPLSAADLTWSYAAVLTMFDARARTTTESWGAADLTLPSTCPTGGGGTGGTSTVTFRVTATTVWGGTAFFCLLGNV
jgi:glucoamylase